MRLRSVAANPWYNEYLDTVIDAAEAAGGIQLKYQNKETVVEAEYKKHADVVTEADHEAEQAVREVIQDRHPDHKIVGEEYETVNRGSDYEWIIDPIDGTMNYYHGFPYYSVSIALVVEDEPWVAGVYAPALEQFYYALQGEGAYLNGTQISVTDTDSISEALISMEVLAEDREQPALNRVHHALLEESHGARLLHGGALSLALTAAGTFDGAVHRGLHPWDMAAGTLLLQEAGATVTDWSGNTEWSALTDGNIVASTPEIHESLRTLCRGCQVTEGIVQGVHNLAEGNTASKEDLDDVLKW